MTTQKKFQLSEEELFAVSRLNNQITQVSNQFTQAVLSLDQLKHGIGSMYVQRRNLVNGYAAKHDMDPKMITNVEINPAGEATVTLKEPEPTPQVVVPGDTEQ
jgi:hypothetical protein